MHTYARWTKQVVFIYLGVCVCVCVCVRTCMHTHTHARTQVSLNMLRTIFFSETGFLCIALAVLEPHFVDQAGLELRNPPDSVSRVLGLKGVHHHAQLSQSFNFYCAGVGFTTSLLWVFVLFCLF